MAKYTIIGRGNIGSTLAKKLGKVGYFPTPDTETIFYMEGAVHTDFDLNPEYHMNKAIQDFLWLLPYCKRHNIRFVFASSALVYEKDNFFSKTKRALELLAQCYDNTLAVRIFPVYGGNEKHSVISKWCEEMKAGKQPTVWGDGTQKRDFIHVEDVANQLLILESMKAKGVADIGAGTPVSFNEILAEINKELGTDIKPIYTAKPKEYSDGIFCKNPLPVTINLNEGIRKIVLG